MPTAAVAMALMSAAAAAPVEAPAAPTERFLAGLVGSWVGTARQLVDDGDPVTRYFRLLVRRQDARTFETRFRYYRPNPQTGKLEEAGHDRSTSVLQPDGSLRRRLNGSGTVLVQYRPKPERHRAAGRARATSADRLEGDATGTIQVEGLPFGLGRHGQIESAREEWRLRDGLLTGRTAIVARFRALLTTRRFRIETVCTARRGADVKALAARTGGKRLTAQGSRHRTPNPPSRSPEP
jgi:hypothetical protein